MTEHQVTPPTSASPSDLSSRGGTYAAWMLLVLLLVSNGPLFLCMSLTDDAAMYDLQARSLLRGGVLYRDILEPNLPGVVWIHTLVRGILGNSSIVLRAVDLALFSCTAALLWNWLRATGAGRRVQAWAVLVLFFCYLSMSEWCHCQRDVWLLLPGLGALTLRLRQVDAWRSGRRPLRSIACWGVVEGLCWGAGVWLKPMIVVPAACCWLVSAVVMRNWRAVLADFVGLVTGGLTMGGAGIAWLHASGAWPHFVTMLVEWNPRYFRAGREHWTALRYVSMLYRFLPWQFIHLAAVPVAVATIARSAEGGAKSRKVEKLKREKVEEPGTERVEKSKSERVEEPESTSSGAPDFSTFRLFDFSTLLLSVFYLAWLGQSYLLQHLFDYVHAPGVLLAVAVLAARAFRQDDRAGQTRQSVSQAELCDAAQGSAAKRAESGRTGRRLGWRVAVAGFLAVALFVSPVLRVNRLSFWWVCVREGSTPEVRDGLRLLQLPRWQELERVADYLRGERLEDGELTCFNSSLIHLYSRLGFGPSTRYAFFEHHAILFGDRNRLLLEALAASRQRYVVTDLIASGMSAQSIERLCPEGMLSEPPNFPREVRGVFPWSQPAIFRAGPYLVHRVDRALGTLSRPRRSVK